MFRKILCTLLTDIFLDRAIPHAMQIPIQLLVFSCNAVATYSTVAEAIVLLPTTDFTTNKPISLNFLIIVSIPLAEIGPQHFFIPITVRNFFIGTAANPPVL